MQKFCSTLDSLAAPITSYAAWQQCLGDDLPRVKHLLTLTGSRAGGVPVPGDPYSWYSVLETPPGKFVGINERTGETTALSREDVLIYRLDSNWLMATINRLLGFQPAVARLKGVPHTYRMARYTPVAGFEFPVFLTMHLEPVDSPPVLESIAALTESPFILFSPTARALRPCGEDILRRRKSCLMPLCDCLSLDDTGRVTATKVASSLLEKFRQALIPQIDVAAPLSFFPTPAGAKWSDLRIRFVDGETVAVSVAGINGTYVYAQMGMADGRNAKPTKQWELLVAFAQSGGVLTWESPAASRKNQKRREILAGNLKAFFRLEGEPIELTADGKGWRTLFAIES